MDQDGYGSPYVRDRVRRIDIPVISQVRNLLATDRYNEAVTLAFQTAVLDLQRAYQQSFPPHWTHLDVLQWARRNGLGPAAEFLARLYELYEPLRYGRKSEVVRGEVLGPLQALYAQSLMWRLYSVATRYALPGYDAYGGMRALPPS
jgi:hypothetical protein